MKKSLLLLAFLTFMLFPNILVKAQWTQINSGTTSDIFTISAFDNGRLIACGGNGTVLTSDDEGLSWDLTTITYQSLVNVHAYGNFCIAISDFGGIFRSNDYGENWNLTAELDLTLRGLHVVGPDKAYVSGQYEMLFESIEQISAWNYIPYVTGPGFWLRDIYFPNDQNGYVVGDGGRAYKTPNSGYGWFLMDTKTQENLTSVYFPSPDTGYCCGSNNTIIKTTDGGLNWFSTFNGQVNDFRNIFFLTNDEGYVSGNDGILMHTVDGGQNWEIELSNVSNVLRDFYYIPEIQRLLVCGHDGVMLYKDLETGIKEMQQSETGNIKVDVYPNPANNQLTFNVQHVKAIPLQLFIYDNTGTKMLQRGNLTGGNIQIDISSFPVGLYQFTFSAGDKTEFSGKFIRK